ncbi:unnamed protein product [Litomosoides sigmodontis]|uniref:Uncharacterized protein n=1 Tax=Litomosoides sigmodontis TaxID=42156 RepID=A0A3P7K2E3_LITSI|nr:unnamed protein product [Litomosoides sigmodontis]
MAESRAQSVQIRGIFRCGEGVPHNATIELWDEDDPLQNFFYQFFLQENGIDPDDKLSTTQPDINGNFEISANHEEFTKLSLYMVVYHQCEHLMHWKLNNFKDTKLQRWRRFVFRIPPRYVNDGEKAVEVFNLGTWNLQFKFMDEELVISCGASNFQPCKSKYPEYSPYLQLFWKHSNLIHW